MVLFVCFQVNADYHVEKALTVNILNFKPSSTTIESTRTWYFIKLAGIEFSHDPRQKSHFARRMTSTSSSTYYSSPFLTYIACKNHFYKDYHFKHFNPQHGGTYWWLCSDF